jgi:filamentous hemagglutinin family protein
MKNSFIHICVNLIFICASLTFIHPIWADPGIVFQNGESAPGNQYYTIEESAGRRLGNNLFHSFKTFNLLKDEQATFTGNNSIQNVINRVTGGASSINGTIFSEISNANFYFINPSGIVFGPHAKIDIQGSFHASTADYIRGADSEKRFDTTSNEPMIFADHPAAFGFLDLDQRIEYGTIDFQGLSEYNVLDYGTDKFGIQTNPGKTISIIGGDITFSEGSYYYDTDGSIVTNDVLSSNGGRINIASVKSAAEVPLQHIFEVDSMDDMNQLATPVMNENNESVIPVHENDIAILTDNDGQKDTYQYSQSQWTKLDDLATIPGTKIGDISTDARLGSIQAFDNANISVNGTTTVQTIPEKPPYRKQGGEIIIKGGTLLIEHSTISSDNYDTNPGGNVYVKGDTITLKDNASIHTDNLGLGQGGSICISGQQSTHVNTISLIRSTLRAASKPNGEVVESGNSGDITIYDKKINLSSSYRLADDVFTNEDIPDDIKQVLRDIDFSYTTKESLNEALKTALKSDYDDNINKISTSYEGTEINSGSSGTGSGGDITIDAQNYEYVSINGKTLISSNAENAGNAGNITIKAPIVTISGYASDPLYGGISSDSSGSGAGGTILIESNLISIAEFAFIKTNALDSGKGGDITLEAKNNISLSKGGYIESSSMSTGQTGRVQLDVDDGIVQISGQDTAGDSSSIRSRCLGAGDGQEISIHADHINLIYGGFIGSETINKGNGGKVSLSANDTISFWGTDNSGYASKIYTTSDSMGNEAGTSGDIKLDAPNINFKDGAGVTASTLGAGNGGTVLVKADILRLSGYNPHGENADGIATGIFARSEFVGPFDSDDKGNANTVSVYAKELYIEDGAVISTSTLGGGNAGDIDVNITEKLVIEGDRLPSNDSESSQTTDKSSQDNEPGLSQINFQSMNDLDTNYESGIFSRSQSSEIYAGNAGKITIKNHEYGTPQSEIPNAVPYIKMDDRASISTSTNGKGSAGNVEIYVKKLEIMNKASISSESNCIYLEPDGGYDFDNDLEIRQIDFKIFSIVMPFQIYKIYSDVRYFNDIEAQDGNILKRTITDGSNQVTEFYVYYDGEWNRDQTGLENYEVITPLHIKASFDDLENAPLLNDPETLQINEKNTISQCQYIDIDNVAIVRSNNDPVGDLSKYEVQDGDKLSFSMEKGNSDSFAYDGSEWHKLDHNLEQLNTDSISDILTHLNENTQFVQVTDYVINRGIDIRVQKLHNDGSQWLPYQSGGDAGTINIKNTDPLIKGEIFITGVNITEENDSDMGNTRISTTTKGAGNAGEISILMQDIYMTDKGEISSASDSEGNGGSAGTIYLGATDAYMDLLDLESEAQISTSTKGLGNAGNINIKSNAISLRTRGNIASSSNAIGESGDAGTILIQTNSLSLIDSGSTINTSTYGQGIAGNIWISTQQLSLDKGASLSSASNSIGKGGDAGQITIGKRIDINEQNELVMSGAADTIFLQNNSTISTSSAGAGKAGNVTLKGNKIDIQQLSSVSSANSSVAEIIYALDTLNQRDALTPKVGMVVEVADAGNGKAQTYIYTGEAWAARNQLSLNRVATMIDLNAINAISGDIAKVTDAGDGYSKNFIYTGEKWKEIVSDKTVQVYVAETIAERNQIDAEKGDIVEIVDSQDKLVDTYQYDSKQWVKTQWSDILDDRTAKAYKVDSLDKISQQDIGDRAALKINDTTTHYIYTNAGNWLKVSKAGDAGKIDIYANDQVNLNSGGSLNTEAISSGGGQISIHGEKSLSLFSGLITASVQKGFGKGGDITTRSKSVLMNHSGIEANAVEGDGGAIFITTEQYIKSDESTVTATSERGNDGTVKIDAPKVDISKGLVVLPTNFLDATRWVKTPCALRSGESVSRLVVEGRDAVPTSLVDWQPSPPTDISVSNQSSKKKKTSLLNHQTLKQPANNMAMKSFSEKGISLIE